MNIRAIKKKEACSCTYLFMQNALQELSKSEARLNLLLRITKST